MWLDNLVEEQIREAMARGDFDNLLGAGKPLRIDPFELLAGDDWLAYHVLANARILPPWLALAREIEQDLEALARLEDRHRLLAEAARRSKDPADHEAAIEGSRQRYEELARAIRRKQENLNFRAPGHRSQRPALWVEHALARLEERAATVAGLSR